MVALRQHKAIYDLNERHTASVSCRAPHAEDHAAGPLLHPLPGGLRYVRLHQLALSPQCGFSISASEHVGVSEEMERAKLARIVEVAREVWGD